jgi:tetratricopeptide (TPR) repeat protein
VYLSVGDFQKAEDYFKESLRLQPNYIEGYRNLIWAEIRQGKFDLAYDYAERLYALYPENSESNGIMAETLANLGKYKEAEEYYRNWLSITKESGEEVIFNRHRFAIILWMNNKKEEARKLFDKHMEVCINSIKSGGLYGKSLAAYDLAGIHALYGDKKEAYVWLRKYEEDGFIWGYHQYILIDPLFENLRSDPDFKAIIRRVMDEKKAVRSKIREMELQGELNLSY